MEISPVSVLLSNASAGGLVQQASLYAARKSMDESSVEAAALIRMMEQVSESIRAARLLDYYA